MKKNVILAIETAIDQGSLSLWRNGSEISGHIFTEKISRSADLLTAIGRLLRKAKIAPDELRKVLVSKEIGSLTGFRVGAATALGLKNSLSIDYAEIDIFDALETFYKPRIGNGLIALTGGKNKVLWKLTNAAPPPRKAFETDFDEEFIEEILKPAVGQHRTVCVNESLYQKIVDDSSGAGFGKPPTIADEYLFNAGNNLAFYYGNFTTEIEREI